MVKLTASGIRIPLAVCPSSVCFQRLRKLKLSSPRNIPSPGPWQPHWTLCVSVTFYLLWTEFIRFDPVLLVYLTERMFTHSLRKSFPLRANYYNYYCNRELHFVYLLICQWTLDCFCLLALVSSAVPRRVWRHLYVGSFGDSTFSFVRRLWFPQRLHHFKIPPTLGFQFLHNSTHTG